MLAQKNRLSKKADFELVFQDGNKIYNQYFNFRFRKNGLDYCRFAIIVSNKISKKATERNKIKRRLKAVIKGELPKFKQNFNVIITVLPQLKELEFTDLSKALLNLLKKSKIYE
jgi:ribonuclease P protein component